MSRKLDLDLGLSYVSFIRYSQWFLTFRCGCTVNAQLGPVDYFDSRVRCPSHQRTLPFMGPTYVPVAEDYIVCPGCDRPCAPYPDQDSPTCAECWAYAEGLIPHGRAALRDDGTCGGCRASEAAKA